MPAYITLLESDDTTPIADPLVTGSIDGGTVYTKVMHVWNDKGATHGDAEKATGVLVSVKWNDGTAEQTSGTPAVDGRWTGIRVTGMNNSGDSTMENQTTAVRRIGSGAVALLQDIPVNCSRNIELTFSPPPGTSNAGYNLVVEVTVGNSAFVLAMRLGTMSGGGVIPDWMDGATRRLTSGGQVTASGTDAVVVASRSYAYDGLPYTHAKESKTLNQTAADGALASGEKYVARISQPKTGGVTVTKGNKGTSPVTPNLPANEIFVRDVNVAYQSGGTSVINTADLSAPPVYGDFLVTDGGGLNARVGIGSAVSSTDFEPFKTQSLLVPLTDNATNTVWLVADGSFTSNTTGLAPSFGAQALATVVTVSGAITSITDLRAFVGHAIYDYVITLRKLGAFSATATDIAWDTAPFDAVIMSSTLEIGKKGTATSGSFKADVTTRPTGTDLGTAGTTIFTSSGSDEQRPSVAYNATVLRAESSGHEVTTVTKGTRIAADIAAVPAGISVNPEDFVVLVYLRRLQ